MRFHLPFAAVGAIGLVADGGLAGRPIGAAAGLAANYARSRPSVYVPSR